LFAFYHALNYLHKTQITTFAHRIWCIFSLIPLNGLLVN
jgi:hypothetical protein